MTEDHAESMSEKDIGRELTNVELESAEHVERDSSTTSAESNQKIPWTFTRCIAVAPLCGSYAGRLFAERSPMKQYL